MRTTVYKIADGLFPKHLRIALAADLHSGSPKAILKALEKEAPDIILLAGDILEALDGSRDDDNLSTMCIFERAAKIAPTFYCTGNHEDGGVNSGSKKWKSSKGRRRQYTEDNLKAIRASGVRLLLDELTLCKGIAIGGLCSGLICPEGLPNLDFLASFANIQGPKILICHHPEYYKKYIKALPIELVVSGHAHGGQWRIFGRGVYAPGQGLFPKYTSGVYEGRLVVTTGLKAPFPIPRFFNPRELVIIET